MGSSGRTVLSITSFLVEWDHAIDVAIDSVTCIYSVEGLCVVVSKTKVMDVLCKTIDIVILLLVASAVDPLV
jgi:hypothetical protein